MNNTTFDSEVIPAIRELWSSGRWFNEHPEKVAGTVRDTFDKYGKAVKEITGTIEDVEKTIKIKQQPSAFPYIIANKPKEVKVINLQKAVEKTKAAEQSYAPGKGENLISMDEMLKTWHPEVTEKEIKIWFYYQRNRIFSRTVVYSAENSWSKYSLSEPEEVQQWITDGDLCFDGREFIPHYLFYAGNIYDKINWLKQLSEKVITEIGEEGYKQQLDRLEKAKPALLRLDAPENERLFISPLDPFATKTNITQLADGTVFEVEYNLVRAYLIWIQTLSKNDFTHKSSVYAINYHFLQNKPFPKDTPAAEKIKTRRNAQLDGIGLFQRFIGEMITREDQHKIEHLWNAEFNNFREIDFKKVPVGFEMNKYFGVGPIDPRPALWEGVKFIGANGSGIIAFDVGVGKTMTAILTVAQALYTGQCKRPLIVVPNPTYKNWMQETVGSYNEDGSVKFNGVLPQYKDRVNDYYNLGVDYAARLTENPPQDHTITFLTYEGLMELGFSQNLQDELGAELFTILNQGLDDRDMEKLREKIDGMLGSATANTRFNIDDLGFDYIVIDEAHNFKKIFTSVKGRIDDNEKGARGKSPYAISSGEPSGRGIKAFMVAQYILRRNNMRNVVLLTATPFTNSPLEIYSMLAMVAYQNLKNRGIVNLVDFFDKFINETSEQAVTVKGKLEEKKVIKSFQNKIVLQNIIFSYIIYKTGEEANVPRPKKLLYPYVKDNNGIILKAEDRVDTALQPTPDQKQWLKEIAAFANAEDGNAIEAILPATYYDEDGKIPGRILIAISLAQNCTLSPYLLKLSDGADGYTYLYNDGERPNYKEFIESSPKLLYTVECMRTVRQHHIKRNEPVSCQVIYMNIATEYFPMIKDYLVNEIGYAANEVEMLIGGMAQTKKERVKNDFLAGKVKVIIGSSTIKEGINLQDKSTCLYVCNLDWNPTDFIQVQGRIWRQKNQFNYVRIVLPMIENSLDVFMFQKLDEKTSRINDIWFRAGRSNVLDVDELDPEELKNSLMTDPKERALSDVRNEVDRIKFEKEIVDGYIKELNQAKYELSEFNEAQQQIEEYYNKALPMLNKQLAGLKQDRAELEGQEKVETDKKVLDAKIKSLQELLEKEVTQKTKYAFIRRALRIQVDTYGYSYQTSIWNSTIDDQIKRESIIDRVQKNILSKNGLTLMDDISPVIEGYEEESRQFNEQIMKVQSEAYIKELVDKYDTQIKENNKLSRPVDDRVKEFTKHNYLLSCLKDRDYCDLETGQLKPAKKKEIVVNKLDDYNSKSVDELVKIKKEKYGNVDISSPMSEEEKLLDKIIAKKFSDINSVIHEKHKNAQRIRIAKARAKALLLILELTPLKEAA